MRHLMRLDAFARAAKRGDLPAEPVRRLQIPDAGVRAADDAPDTPVEFVMSTSVIDRVGDTIAVDGWELDNYLKNPVILFAHDSHDLPIGKAVRVWKDEGSLRCLVKFTDKDEYERGYTVGQLVRRGYLNAGSVGFRPKEWEVAEDRDESGGWFPPVDFKTQELLEYSVVPVPANPEALVAAKAAGIDVESIAEWAEQTLEETRGRGFWMSRGDLERIWKASATRSIVSVPKEEPATCGECGALLEPEWKFCPACGTAVGEKPKAADIAQAVSNGISAAIQARLEHQ